MKIDSLHLENFKNYENLSIVFPHQITSVVGLNGAGKTNILDALHYLAFTKSAFGITDNQSILHEKPYFMVETEVIHSTPFTVKCYFERNQKKIVKLDNQIREKYSDHIGTVSLVLSSPYDSEILRGSSEIRRKWVDGCISLFDLDYLEVLLQYQKLLRQRNSHLKHMDGRTTQNALALLDTYDDQLIPLSESLSSKRSKFVKHFIPFFHNNVSSMIDKSESSSISYSTKIDENFETEYRDSREKDILTQRTNLGAHKDDFIFLMDGYPIKKFGSQGQQKTFLIALKLAQYDYLKSLKDDSPVLLLDDVFDKLDDQRIEKLTHLLADGKRFGQVILTDARKERTLAFLGKLPDFGMIEIENGSLKT